MGAGCWHVGPGNIPVPPLFPPPNLWVLLLRFHVLYMEDGALNM